MGGELEKDNGIFHVGLTSICACVRAQLLWCNPVGLTLLKELQRVGRVICLH